ncbi:MAG: radical SAM protein, partial [Acidimicrobiia bacterium]|nr:radical SAM protein [Acidimicrobiia bacterium]
MRLLLVSTYELGHQPLHLASPAAALAAAGHEVVLRDVAVDGFDASILEDIDAVAVSVPMHTAARLAQDVVDLVRSERPGTPVALFGLYAAEGSFEGVSARFVGEYEPDLVAWADGGSESPGVRVSIAHGKFSVPLRDSLPHPDRYGRLDIGGELRLAGYVEASHGCRHRCRHCPIPAVYDGRYRIVDGDTVEADIDGQVSAGVRHITWGDPDFLNGPRHAVDVLERVHRRHPDVTHDLTIKVEHLRRHSDLLPRLAAAGVLFIVSAFESCDDHTLRFQINRALAGAGAPTRPRLAVRAPVAWPVVAWAGRRRKRC